MSVSLLYLIIVDGFPFLKEMPNVLSLNPEVVLVPTLISLPSIIKGAVAVDAPSQSMPILPTKSLATPVIPI